MEKQTTIRKKVLLVAYAFPPIPYGGTYRCLRLCRAIEKYHVQCHVLTINQYKDIPNDNGLLKRVPDTTIIHRTPIIDPWRRYQVLRKKMARNILLKFIDKIVALSLRLITFPDHMLFWVPFAVAKAKKIIREEKIKTVFVSSPPNSAQLIGFLLKKKENIKWIADFRDPIYGNVAEVKLISPTDILSRIEKHLSKRYEKLIVKTADFLIANTETHRKSIRNEYGANNVITIRNGFDAEDFLDIRNDGFDKFTISHIGSVYGRRQADILFAGLKQLLMEMDHEKPDLQVFFVGQTDKSLYEKAKAFGVAPYVKIMPQVSHEKAISLMKRSDLLLLIKATGKWSEGQIPGKFYEYVGARKRILCIGPLKSEVANLIRDKDLGYVVEENIFEMVSILSKEYHLYRNPQMKNENFPQDAAAEFDSDNMAKKVSNLLT